MFLINAISSLILLINLLVMIDGPPNIDLMFLLDDGILSFLILIVPVVTLISLQVVAQSRENIAMLALLCQPLTVLLVVLIHSTDIYYKSLSNYYLVLKYYYYMSQKN